MPPGSFVSRIKSTHADHRAIAQGMVVGATFVFLSKLAGAAKEMAVAWQYGMSAVVDAYLYVMNLVAWPVAVWFGVLGVVLVPLSAKIRERASGELLRFRPELLGLTLILGTAALLCAEVGLPLLLRSRLGGLSGAPLAHALEMAPILSLTVLLGFPISVFSVWMTAGGRVLNTLQEGIAALVILAFVLLARTGTAAPLVLGTVAGYCVHLLSLVISLARRRELERPRFSLQSPHWPDFWRGFGIMLAGQAVLGLGPIIDQLFAARLGVGAIATLGYANRVVVLLLGLGATAVSRASLPVFSEAHARSDVKLERRATQWAVLLFVIGAAVVLVGWWLAPFAVQLLFQRGAFTAGDTVRVADILRFALVQVPFYFASLVLVSLVSAKHDYKSISLAGVVGLIVKLAGNALLVPLWGLRGLALVNSFVYASGVLFLAIVSANAVRHRPT